MGQDHGRAESPPYRPASLHQAGCQEKVQFGLDNLMLLCCCEDAGMNGSVLRLITAGKSDVPPRFFVFATLAQSAEQLICNQQVMSSILIGGFSLSLYTVRC